MRCVDCTWISPWDRTCINPDSPSFTKEVISGEVCPCYSDDWSKEEGGDLR